MMTDLEKQIAGDYLIARDGLARKHGRCFSSDEFVLYICPETNCKLKLNWRGDSPFQPSFDMVERSTTFMGCEVKIRYDGFRGAAWATRNDRVEPAQRKT